MRPCLKKKTEQKVQLHALRLWPIHLVIPIHWDWNPRAFLRTPGTVYKTVNRSWEELVQGEEAEGMTVLEGAGMWFTLESPTKSTMLKGTQETHRPAWPCGNLSAHS